jgi:hypothetical protein
MWQHLHSCNTTVVVQKNGNHARVESMTQQSWTSRRPPTNSHAGGTGHRQVPHLHAGFLHLRCNEYTRNINRAMGALGEEVNDNNVSLGMTSPTETDKLEGMEGSSKVPSTIKKSNTRPRCVDQRAPSNTIMVLRCRG